MAETSASPSAPGAAEAAVPSAEQIRDRDDWFTTTPDPWREVARLEYGGDRTHASTIQRLVTKAEPDQRPAIERQLIAVLQRPELTDAGRLFVCRMLGLIGTALCVPAVVTLLTANRTADAARIALDEIADPAVDAAYGAALGQLTGAARAGLSGSIAFRRERRGELPAPPKGGA